MVYDNFIRKFAAYSAQGPINIGPNRQQAGPNVVWETHRVTLHKAPTFGFGIAVSGGRDSPHFANGDPSVAISDVLKAGPAEGKLQINDRIVTVNGTSLENVDHATAINVLRDCGNTVSLVVRRRILLPSLQTETPSPPFKITLNKKNKKDDFGVINNTPVESLSVQEARKLMEKSKDRLQLIVKKEREEDRGVAGAGGGGANDGAAGAAAAAAGAMGIDADLLPARVRDKDDVNLYRPSVRSEDDMYMKDTTLTPGAVGGGGMGGGLAVPAGAYPNSENTRYDGHYVLDNDLPPRPGRDLEPGLPYSLGDQRDIPSSRHNNGYLSDNDHSGFYPPASSLPRAPPVSNGSGYLHDDDDVFPQGPGQNNISMHERYVDMRSDVRLEPRKVTFPKDKQTGLGLRLAGGNATGIYIASVQPGSAGEREGLVEGDNILMANEGEISGMTREEAVSYLTSLTGQVTMLVQYRKEDYDRIMASNEAGDSFYIRTHFSHTGTDQATEHSFQVGDVFHVKDTHFRGGGAWLALRVSEDLTEIRKGTIPNSKTAEVLKAQQKDDGADKDGLFPQRGRGSLFKRKSSRRSKSLGKDHWDEVVFAGLNTKFPAYERVVFTEPGFVRPVVIYGAIADIARERLLAEYPDRFECPQVEKSSSGEKKEKSAIIRLGVIRDAIAQRKHCLLDITPSNVDRLNYAQYNPIVVFLRAENKQCVKDVRGRWKTGGGARNPRKLLEHSEKLEREYSHLFTGVLKHMGTDAWFPKLCEMIDSQQRQPIWMSEVKPLEDISDDFMFPMSTRLSYAAAAGGADSDMEQSRRDLSPGYSMGGSQGLLGQGQMSGGRMVRSSSDPSINTQENIPGIPPYPSPPTYKNQRIPSDSRYSISEASQRSHRDDYQMHPEDRYYPSYYTDHQVQASRANIDPYATLTPSERLRPRVAQGHFDRGFNEFSPHRDGMDFGGLANKGGGGEAMNQPGMPDNSMPNGMPSQGVPGQGPDHRGQTDASSHSSDSYSKYTLGSPLNKHDDTKLREKFASSLKANTGGSGGGSAAHDPYRFTRSTANPVASSGTVVDRAKLSDLQARYRKQDGPGSNKNLQKLGGSPTKKKEPPPVPVKTFSLKQRGINLESDEMKMRNYENSNR
ncbi:tight junction protein zo-1 [Plakobranchus ocellatus]|uniref:Tight junction protein zo-1 n=1 Tax=Plakobranchus ocellatus TaxID=259542 RepID=A0AAV4CG06_9GAST|nr:tight junction protein zo-1 [Plakobranchus ocellatus]